MVGKVNIPMSSGSGGTLVINGQDTISCVAQEALSANDPVCYNEKFTPTVLPGIGALPSTMIAEFSSDGTYIATTHTAAPYLLLYKYNSQTNLWNLANEPDVIPGPSVNCMKWSADDNYLFVGCSASPYLIVYKRIGDALTKLPNPSVLPPQSVTTIGYGECTDYPSLADGFVTVSFTATPWVYLYEKKGDVLTKKSFTAGISSSIQSFAFSQNSTYLAIGHYSSTSTTIPLPQVVRMYKRSGLSFDVITGPYVYPVYANSSGATFYHSSANAVAFSPDGNYFAVGLDASPYILIYKRYGDSFYFVSFKGNIVNAGAIGSVNYRGLAFSPDSKYLFIGHTYSPYVTVLKRVKDVFTGYSFSTPSSSACYSISFSKTSNLVALTYGGSSPKVAILKLAISQYDCYKADSKTEVNDYDGFGYVKTSAAINDTIDVVRFIK